MGLTPEEFEQTYGVRLPTGYTPVVNRMPEVGPRYRVIAQNTANTHAFYTARNDSKGQWWADLPAAPRLTDVIAWRPLSSEDRTRRVPAC